MFEMKNGFAFKLICCLFPLTALFFIPIFFTVIEGETIYTKYHGFQLQIGNIMCN
jgi:hypothetical protein